MRGSVLDRSIPRAETDVGYANARLRGMKANLLKSAFFDQLIEAPDMYHAIQVLQDTDYAVEIEESLIHGRTAGVVDEALKDNIVRVYRKVLDFLNPEARTIIAVLLGKWDAQNIKTVLRGAQNNVPLEQVKASLMPLGYLSETELEALARVGDARGVIDTLRTWENPYSVPLRDGWADYHSSGDLSDLELSLDKYWATRTSKTLSRRGNNYQVAKRVFGTQIDVVDLVMIFRLLRADADQVRAERYYLEGGRYIHKDLFVELAQLSDVDEVLDRLRRTPYAEALDNAAMRYLEFNSISVFERAMEMKLLRQAMLTGVRDPQGIGVPITYLYAKANEVTNLRIIIQGKAVGMPAERVREDLILV